MNHVGTIKNLVKESKWANIVDLISNYYSLDNAPFEVAISAYKAYTHLGSHSEAELWLDRGLFLSPKDPNLLRTKGNFHSKRQEWEKAVYYLETATRIRPDVAIYHGALAYAFFMQAKYDEAISEFRVALELDSTTIIWWIRLGRSYLHLNEFDKAADAYASALELKEDEVTRYQYEELLQQINSTSKAPSSVYYDAVYSTSKEYQQPAEESLYAPIWHRIQNILQKQKVSSILDLGCGPGQFAEYISEKLPNVKYTGLDFSSVAITSAQQRCPEYVFMTRMLPLDDFNDLPVFDSIVCTEVLEHVEQDIEILAKIPAGIFILASVPNFDSFGHVRLFLSEQEVRNRYDKLIDNLVIDAIELSKLTTIWLMSGTRSKNVPDT